jgi:5'-nucleotidase
VRPRPPIFARLGSPALVLAALLAAFACTSAPEHRRPDGRVHLVVLHTNDMHGQVLPRPATWIDRDKPPQAGGLPRVAAFVSRVRRDESAAGSGVLVLDGGDWYQGTPEGVVDQGLPCVEAITAIGYDAASLGNHEFDHGLANLRRLLDKAHPPAICANVHEPATGRRVAWIAPWRVVEAGGLRIALVGLLTPDTPSITHPDARQLTFSDPCEEIERAERELAGRYDLLIPLGHIGIEEGQRIARAHPEIPLVVTGHSHTFLREGQREGSTLIVQAGAKASVVGRVDLEIDGPSATVVESKAQLCELLDEPAPQDRNARVEKLCGELVAAADASMREVVGRLAAPLRAGRGPYATVAGSWVADLLRARTGADVGFHNRGGIRAEIEAGPVTRRAVFEVLPFDNDVVTLELTGAELEALVRRSIEGSARSGLDYSGLVAFVQLWDENGKVRLRLARIEVGGKPLDPARMYRVTTNSFLAGGGDGFDELAHGRARSEDPILLRELAVEALLREGTLTPPSDARIVATSEAQSP